MGQDPVLVIQAPYQVRSHRQRVTKELRKHSKRKGHTNKVGFISKAPAIIGLMDRQQLEQQEVWQLERRHFFSEATMAKIPEPEEPLELTDGDPSALPAANFS